MGGCQSTVLAFSIHHYSLCAVLLIIQGWASWVRRPSNGRMGTSAPTQGCDRFRRGRCPQRPVDNGRTPVVPLIRHGCAMPPSPLRGEGFGRSVGNAQMSMAFPSSVTAYAVPPSPRGRHCAGEFSLPPPRGKAIYILKYSNMIQHFVLKNALSYPCLSPHTLLDTEGHAG